MGLDYEYELYFRREELWSVLQSVGKMSGTGADGTTEIILPDRKIALPFTSGFAFKTIHFQESKKELDFDTSLYFEPDDAIEQYVKEQEEHIRQWGGEHANWVMPRDEEGRVPIGNIYLYIWLDSEDTPGLISFDFVSATTRMGVLFTESPSIRGAFIRLLEWHNGVYGLLKDSDYLYNPVVIYPPNCSWNQASAPRDL
jgi:hypothetical protein